MSLEEDFQPKSLEYVKNLHRDLKDPIKDIFHGTALEFARGKARLSGMVEQRKTNGPTLRDLEEAIPMLAEVLADHPVRIRKNAAAELLGKLSHHYLAREALLEKALDSEEELDVRENALKALVQKPYHPRQQDPHAGARYEKEMRDLQNAMRELTRSDKEEARHLVDRFSEAISRIESHQRN